MIAILRIAASCGFTGMRSLNLTIPKHPKTILIYPSLYIGEIPCVVEHHSLSGSGTKLSR